MNPTEEKCKDCEHFTTWCGPYGNVCYPACSHPEAGARVVTLLSEIDKCPKEK